MGINKITRKIIILFIIIFSIGSAQADLSVEQQIKNLIFLTDPDLNIGIKITNLDQNKIIFEKNANRYYIPASTLKFISIISILNYLGEDYQFTSSLFKKDNDYYLQISDPDFSTRDLSHLISKLVKISGKNISGNFYIINNKFSVPAIVRDKTHSDSLYCYGAPITKVHINKNCSKVMAKSNGKGKKTIITTNKDFPYIINNQSRSISQSEPDRLNISIIDNKYIIKGTLGEYNAPQIIGATSHNNLGQVKYYLKKQLSNNNINLKGQIFFGTKVAAGSKKIASVTNNIKKTAATALKKSDNFITNYFLAIFASKYNIKEWDWAALALKKIIKKTMNVDLDKSDIKEGAGISRQNLLTINQFDSFLKAVAKSKNFETVKSLLAVPSEESTLKGRFNNIDIYAKTGSLTGVSGLVGYFYNSKGELHSFVIISNNFHQNRLVYNKLEEEIIALVSR
jgi:D-alanyl-D-alanine carboxypeptidase/D-alanyl-D-alanine-endopeptidase (penicillin-binding protein 4)